MLLDYFWKDPEPVSKFTIATTMMTKYLEIAGDQLVENRLLQFVVCLLLNWWFFRRQQHRLQRTYRQPLDLVALNLSSYHAIVISMYHLARLWIGNDIDPQLLVWSQSWTTAYALNDLLLIIACIRSIPRIPKPTGHGRVKMSDILAIVHHLGMIGCVGISFSSWTQLDKTVKDLWSLGYLSELSTPLLNLIKIKLRNGVNPGRMLTWLFIFLYLGCRPINLAYLSYRGWQIYGVSLVPTICFCFWLLNTYWFNLILRKYQKHTKPYKKI